MAIRHHPLSLNRSATRSRLWVHDLTRQDGQAHAPHFVRQGSGPAVYDVVKGAAGGTDVISGFRPGTNQVQLFGYLPFEQQVTSSGGSSLISLADGTKIQIVGVTNLGSSIVG